MPTLSEELAALQRQAAELRAALKQERERAAIERRRAETAVESAARAWRVAMGASRTPREDH